MELGVLNNVEREGAAGVSSAERLRIAADLEAMGVGEVRFDRHNRMLYATDASIYQIEPIGVVLPGSIEQMQRIVEYCGRNRIAMLPRGGGTSLPGQCVNRAVVVDYSRMCRQVLSLDAAGRTCLVEPGITIDELNRYLDAQKSGLFFAPDPATAAQASIGGCIGNNAAGARSIRYGRTSENVLGLDVVLSSGERTWLGAGAGRNSTVARRLAAQVAAVVREHAQQIRDRFPKTTRRNAGYALDMILAQLDRGVAAEELGLTGLLCGSEGTLAVTLAAKVKLHPVPRSKGLAIVSFATLEEAIDAVPRCLQTGACAVELLDDVVLTAARGNAECRRYLELVPQVNGVDAQAVLYVEYQETGPVEEVKARFQSLRQTLGSVPMETYLDQGALLKAWALRKAGEPLLHGLSGHRKPVTCVEDNAVPLENLARFVAGFKQIVGRHGTRAAYWAHAAVGVLHVRPMLDLHDPADREHMRGIAAEVAEWARQCGGVMSGEHGDGRIRGPLLERYFGPDIMRAFRQIKAIFDPAGILNPGNIVQPGPVESMTEKLRVKPDGGDLRWPTVETYFDYSSQEGFAGAVEMCNGAGVCRKTAVGTMCPSYRATLDERHTTRGRGNALRLAISGQLSSLDGQNPQPAWEDPETLETLRLCLSCKACKSECPSNVDMAKLRAEYLAQSYRYSGVTPLAARVFGHIRQLNRLASIAPNVANWVNSLRPVRKVMDEVLGLAPQRSVPASAPSLYRWFRGRERTSNRSADTASCGADSAGTASKQKVVLFADCFVTYNEPEIGQDAVRVLEALGYEVLLPKVGCCGRSMISMGLLPDAMRSADAVLGQLRPYIEDESVKAVVVCEPSCLSAMKDDWLGLKLKTEMGLRKQLAAKAMLVEEFVERFWEEHPAKPATVAEGEGRQVVLHGHCHQKALWGDQTSAAVLRRLLGERLRVLPSGCCGMAGAFGYTRDKYDVSMRIGEQSLFSLLRDVQEDAVVVAPGTSCRHQIKDGTQRDALHPVELLARLLVRDTGSASPVRP